MAIMDETNMFAEDISTQIKTLNKVFHIVSLDDKS